jgi:hypothetical protein
MNFTAGREAASARADTDTVAAEEKINMSYSQHTDADRARMVLRYKRIPRVCLKYLNKHVEFAEQRVMEELFLAICETAPSDPDDIVELECMREILKSRGEYGAALSAWLDLPDSDYPNRCVFNPDEIPM